MIPPKGSIPGRTRASPTRPTRRHFEPMQEEWKPRVITKKLVKPLLSSQAILEPKLNELAGAEKLLRQGGLGTIQESLQRYASILKADIERIRKGG